MAVILKDIVNLDSVPRRVGGGDMGIYMTPVQKAPSRSTTALA